MKVVTTAIPVIKLVPRFYPVLSDALELVFDNGMIVPFEWVVMKNHLVLTITDTTSFVQGQNYSFTILKDQDILYKGKVIFVANGTDVQNYSANSQNTKRWQ